MLFSIITVTYNAEKWIGRTIQSIISQTYQKIEYIIIDGNSTDGTLEIIKKHQPAIARLISEPDKGLYDAMNKGLGLASGDYVWFINAGDTLYSDTIVQEIVEKIDATALDQYRGMAGQARHDRPLPLPDIIYGETKIVDENGDSLGMRRLKTPDQLTWKSFRMGMLVCHQSFLVKRTIAEPFDLQYRFTADYDWCIRCLKKADSIFNTGLILSRFLEAGISAANRKEALKERYRIMCDNFGKFSTQIRHIWFAIRFYTAKLTKKTVS